MVYCTCWIAIAALKCPERFQDCREQFDVTVTVEERVYDQVLENMEYRDVVDNRPVHIFNVDIEDNHEEALMGAFLITDMINMNNDDDFGIETQSIATLLNTFKKDIEVLFNSAIDRFSSINLMKNNTIIEKETDCFSCPIASNKMEQSEKSIQEVLGPFETTESSLDVSQFYSYRKSIDPKEKINKFVVRKPGEAAKQVRQFKSQILDGSFKVNPDLVFSSADNPKLNLTKNKFVIDVIRQEYLKINNTCVISFYNIKYLVSGLLAYGYCTFPDCCKYRFKVNLNGNVSVQRTGEIFHGQGQKRVAQIRGVTRALVKKSLKNTSAYTYRKDKILEAADDIAKSGNFQNIQNLSTVRKVKSEGHFDGFYDPNPFIDVYLMKQGYYKNYLQYIASPLAIHCWENKTFQTFNNNPQILKDANYTIHVDATGQSVKQIECAEKRILIYKIVIRIKKLKMILPIVTAILSRHTMLDICYIFERLEMYCKERKFKWPFFERVCTDVSYALFGGILKCCNKQNVSEYLNDCFAYLESPKLATRPKVIIQWCKAHYVHIICKDLNNKIGKNHILRNLLKNVLTLAFDLKTMNDCKFWFNHIFIVLLTPKKSHAFRDSFKILKKNILEINETDFQNLNMFDDNEQNSLETIASRSPFKKFFENIYDNVCNDLKDDDINFGINDYHNEDICRFILKKYCPFLPMWTNIMGIMVDPSGDHISNAPVEFNFYLQKHILLKNKSVRPGDFIKIDRKDNMSTLKELRYHYHMYDTQGTDEQQNMASDINKNKNTDLLQISKEHDYELIEVLEPEENWNKKNEKNRKAIKPKFLSNAKKPKKLKHVCTDVQDIIKLDVDNTGRVDNASRIIKEHAYYQEHKNKEFLDKNISCNVKFYLLRYNNLFKTMYPKLKQFDIGFYNLLDIEDWQSLKKGSQLTNFVVDCTVLCIIKEQFSNILSLPCQINEISFDKVNKLVSYKPNFIVIPILKCGHFNLCILNLMSREFIFIDSLYDDSGKDHYNNFVSLNDKSWKFVKISERSKQGDGNSCGVFIIMYVFHYFCGKSLLNLPKSDDYRETIKSILIRNADDNSLFCCHCGNVKKVKTKCSLCQHSVCKECKKSVYNNDFIACKICSNNILN